MSKISPFEDFSNHFMLVHNAVFDVVMRKLDGAPLKVLLAIMRMTRGFGKEADYIGLGVLAKYTGLSEQGVLNSVEKLADMVLCSRNKKTPARYAINRQWVLPQ